MELIKLKLSRSSVWQHFADYRKPRHCGPRPVGVNSFALLTCRHVDTNSDVKVFLVFLGEELPHRFVRPRFLPNSR